jgi:hypothetical protein
LLLLLSRAHYCPTSHQVHRSLSPLLSLWPATTLLGLWLPMPLPLYRSASPTRWPPFRPLRRRPLRLMPTCMPSPSSSKKNMLPSLPYRLRPRRLPCSWHQPPPPPARHHTHPPGATPPLSPRNTCRTAGYRTFTLLSRLF